MQITRNLFMAVLLLASGASGLMFGKPQQSAVAIWGLKHLVRVSTLAGHSDVTGTPTPATLCAYSVAGGATIDCFQARASGQVFFGQPNLDFVSFTDSEKAVIFTARFDAGGSGSSSLWALLVFGQNGKWRNLLPVLTTSEQSDHLYWRSGDVSGFGLFSVADYIFEKGETHFGTHKYDIRTFEFCPSRGTYVLADQFITKETYPGLDAVDAVRVIEPNLSLIRQRLLEHRPEACH
jgi:hypothetical protein